MLLPIHYPTFDVCTERGVGIHNRLALMKLDVKDSALILRVFNN